MIQVGFSKATFVLHSLPLGEKLVNSETFIISHTDNEYLSFRHTSNAFTANTAIPSACLSRTSGPRLNGLNDQNVVYIARHANA